MPFFVTCTSRICIILILGFLTFLYCISKEEKKIALISTTDKNLAEKLRNELRKIYKHHQIYSTVGLDKNKKYALIANCEIFIACLSDIYYKDNTCRKGIHYNKVWLVIKKHKN